MSFKFFSKTPAAADKAGPSAATLEGARLDQALFGVLGAVTQTFSGRENVRMLCQTLGHASPHIQLAWLGFADGGGESVAPYAYAGPCDQEARDWSLPVACFTEGVVQMQTLSGPGQAQALFSPWQGKPGGSVRAALALPLRSEKEGLSGLLVLYADREDYFELAGLARMQAFAHIAEIVWKQSNLVRIATQVAQQDPLTGLLGRRHAMSVLEKEIRRAERNQQALSLLLCRIDGLSKLNDMLGLQGTDDILAAFASQVQALLRPADAAARWTSKDVLFILPGMDLAQAETLAQRLREQFGNNPVHVRNWSVRLSLRTGTASHTRHSLGLDDLVLQAHQSLSMTEEDLVSSVL